MILPRALLRSSGLALLAAGIVGSALRAQGTTQLSGTGVLVYPHSDQWTFVGELNPSQVVDGTPTWREVTLDVGAERSLTPAVDLIGYAYLIHTNQFNDINTTEYRFRLGGQPFFRLRPRWFLQTRVVYEGRFIHYQGGTNEFTQRLRVRLFSRITIRKRTEYIPGAVYLRGDAEGYVPIGDKANERYFDKVQFRLGAGFRLSRHDQMELDFVSRASQTTFGLDHDNADGIIELRYTKILRKRTPDRPHPSP